MTKYEESIDFNLKFSPLSTPRMNYQGNSFRLFVIQTNAFISCLISITILRDIIFQVNFSIPNTLLCLALKLNKVRNKFSGHKIHCHYLLI